MRERFAFRYASLIGNPANAWARNGAESPLPFEKSDAVCSCAGPQVLTTVDYDY